MKLLVLLFVFLAHSLAGELLEYKLLKEFRTTKDVKTAFFLLKNYPDAVFVDELRVELASLLISRGEIDLAKSVAEKVDLRNVRDEYGKEVSKLWRKLDLDPKPLVLRFPELSLDMLEVIHLTPEEEERVLKRLIRKKKFEYVLKLSTNCFLRGMALYKMKKYRDSLTELNECTDERASMYVLLNYLRLKDLKSAEEFVKKANSRNLYFRLGSELLSLGYYRKARRFFLLSGSDSRSFFYAGIVDFIRGKYLLSYEGFSEAERLARGNEEKAKVYFWKAKVLEKLGAKELSLHYLGLASRMGGFYSAVAKTYLGDDVYEEPDLQYTRLDTHIANRLISIKKLGFLHYMRLEALKNTEEFTPADVIMIARVDPYIAIKVAVRAFGTGSEVYRAVAFPTPFEDIVRRASNRFGVDRALIYAVMRQESLFNERAISRSDAKGLMQLIDSTARWKAERLGIELKDIYDAEINITLGTAYLKYLLDLWEGDLVKAIASYNAGQGAVGSWIDYDDDFVFIETIPYTETRRYVKKVLWYYYVYSEKLSK